MQESTHLSLGYSYQIFELFLLEILEVQKFSQEQRKFLEKSSWSSEVLTF